MFDSYQCNKYTKLSASLSHCKTAGWSYPTFLILGSHTHTTEKLVHKTVSMKYHFPQILSLAVHHVILVGLEITNLTENGIFTYQQEIWHMAKTTAEPSYGRLESMQ